jgi:dephospho-CoA kinase
MLIGINGALGAGKDTAGAYFVSAYGFNRIAFADLLKESAGALFGIDPDRWNEWKNDSSMEVLIQRNLSSEIGKAKLYGKEPPVSLPHVRLTVREFLQRYGTEAHRDVFGYDFWIDQALMPYDDHVLENVVVTDVRFENEIEAVKKRGGYMMKVVRPETGGDSHISERLFPNSMFDFVIHNDRTIQELYDRLDEVMQSLSGRAQPPLRQGR